MAFPGCEGGHCFTDGNGAGFHESVEIGLVDFQAPWRSDFQAAPALVALFHVQVHSAGSLLVFHDGFEGTGCGNLRDGSCRVRAVFGEPVLVEMHGVVHLAARLAGHAAQGEVLDGCSEAVGWVSLDVGEVDQERWRLG